MAQMHNCLARTRKTEPTTVFLSCAEMHIRSLAKFKCRYCDAPVEADAGVCHCCGVAYPTSQLRAVLLNPFAIAFASSRYCSSSHSGFGRTFRNLTNAE
jgi:hypothetical protein